MVHFCHFIPIETYKRLLHPGQVQRMAGVQVGFKLLEKGRRPPSPPPRKWLPNALKRNASFTEIYLQANRVQSAEKKRASFLTVVGPTTFKLLRSIIVLETPADKTFEELVEVLTKYFSPLPSEIVQRFKFHSRFRHPGESVATFMPELCLLSEFCNFGDSLDSMLRDRLVCGIQDENIQKRLLAEKKLTFAKAMELVQRMEAATKNVRELHSPQQAEVAVPSEVHQVGPPQQQSPRRDVLCYRCGKKGHTAAKCRFKNAECHLCGKVGHLKAVCRNREGKSPNKQPQQSQQHSV